jgi:hypothetical protein
MQFAISFLALALFIGSPVAAEYAVKVFFNNGLDEPGKSCSDADLARVTNAMYLATLKTTTRRELTAVTAAWCKAQCGDARYCFLVAPKCLGVKFRRTMEESETDLPSDETTAVSTEPTAHGQNYRDLQWVDNTCSQDITLITAALSAVKPSLAPSCQALLNAERSMNCIDVDSCVIHYLDLWNADTDKLVKGNFPDQGGTICLGRTKYSFRAVTNYCVSSVRFDMWGPGGYYKGQTEIGAPFYLYGDSGTDIFGDMPWQVGGYTIHSQADGLWSKVKTVQFEVKNCGAIERFDLWNADTNTVKVSNFPANGGSICAGDRFSLQAITNSQTQKVRFDIWGPNHYSGRTEETGRNFLYGSNGNDVYGATLQQGWFTMKAFVNDDYASVKEVNFEAKQCAAIVRFDLYNADTDAVMITDFPANGGTVCKTKRVSFRAVTNSYAQKARFDMWGYNYYSGRTEQSEQYYMYGYSGSDVLGEMLGESGYTMKVWLNDDYSTVKEVNFNVINC